MSIEMVAFLIGSLSVQSVVDRTTNASYFSRNKIVNQPTLKDKKNSEYRYLVKVIPITCLARLTFLGELILPLGQVELAVIRPFPILRLLSRMLLVVTLLPPLLRKPLSRATLLLNVLLRSFESLIAETDTNKMLKQNSGIHAKSGFKLKNEMNDI